MTNLVFLSTKNFFRLDTELGFSFFFPLWLFCRRKFHAAWARVDLLMMMSYKLYIADRVYSNDRIYNLKLISFFADKKLGVTVYNGMH